LTDICFHIRGEGFIGVLVVPVSWCDGELV
jgi:hypothetical protein